MDTDVTQEEQTKALKICGEHLSGVWEEVPISLVTITKLSGGMTNLLYRCALFELVETYQAEPREVLLRLYGPTHSDTATQLEIFNQLASENLGPNLYATFDGGRLEEYLPSHPLTWTELTDDDISAVVARKIAAVHKLNVQSLAKKFDWLINKYNQYNDFLEKSVKRGVPKFSENTLVLTKDIALFMIEIDFKPEIEYMSALFENSRAPLVFSHNDLHQNNILLRESDKDQDLNDRIVLIDFEYCSYNYRSFDIANHLSEWCFDYSAQEYPYFTYSAERFPTEEKQRRFLANYVNELSDMDFKREKETSDPDKERLDDFDKTDILLEEMQPFFMASNLLWALWAIHSAYTSKIKFGYWEMAKCKWDTYLLCKERLRCKTCTARPAMQVLQCKSRSMFNNS